MQKGRNPYEIPENSLEEKRNLGGGGVRAGCHSC